MKLRLPDPTERMRYTNTPMIITNYCSDTIWPAVNTQSGTGPSQTGFELSSGESYNQTVSENWQGRVWGRANCSFNDNGGPSSGNTACASGDCNGQLNCYVSGNNPVTLAEFTLDAGDGHTYYDISLVDGYNLPLAIVLQPLGNASIDDIPPNLTNPSCMATAGWLAAENFYPYENSEWFLGTNGSYPLPFETNVTNNDVMEWCPWDLQVNTPEGSPDGVYTYPDTTVQRPYFDPCYSACAKYYSDEYCCTGEYNSPESCQANYYANAAKSVCPDAYSFAYDDQSSTFIIPSGAGFQIVFCPGGRSTNILATEGNELRQLASSGTVSTSQSTLKVHNHTTGTNVTVLDSGVIEAGITDDGVDVEGDTARGGGQKSRNGHRVAGNASGGFGASVVPMLFALTGTAVIFAVVF